MSAREDSRCDECGQPFTPQEWDARHGTDTDVHERCCKECQDEEREATRLKAVTVNAWDLSLVLSLADEVEDKSDEEKEAWLKLTSQLVTQAFGGNHE